MLVWSPLELLLMKYLNPIPNSQTLFDRHSILAFLSMFDDLAAFGTIFLKQYFNPIPNNQTLFDRRSAIALFLLIC